MSLKERIYSVLIVSAAEKLNVALLSLLPESRYAPVHFADGVTAAKRMLVERNYDFVIINSPLPDDMGARFASDIANTPETVALLLLRPEVRNNLPEKFIGQGIFTLTKPVARQTFDLALDWMAATRERLGNLESKKISLEEKMEEIRLVNRAKWILISKKGMDESSAHRLIEKQAMDRCVSKKQIAEEIIDLSRE